MKNGRLRMQMRNVGLAVLSLAMIAAIGSSAHAQIPEVGNGGPGPVKASHLTAELTTLSPQIAVGGTLQAGLVLTIEDHWLVSWIKGARGLARRGWGGWGRRWGICPSRCLRR